MKKNILFVAMACCQLSALSLFAQNWSLTGNAGTTPATHFIGTTDGRALQFKINNQKAGYLGMNGNTFWGMYSGNAIISGISNTGNGGSALSSTTTGSHNVAIGYCALLSNTTGNYNTANGSYTLLLSTTGTDNTATGSYALLSNITGGINTANGRSALYSNTDGHSNTAAGVEALYSNTNGNRNTGIGTSALAHNTTGSDNTSVGFNAGTAPGIFNNTVSIGNNGYLNGYHNQAFIGNLSTGWIGGNVGWSTFSDARVKVNMQHDVKGLDFIMRLNPVTYYRKIDLITTLTANKSTEDYPEKYAIEKIKFSGFLAQEVEQAAKEAGYDFNGITRPKKETDLYSLSYESFVVPLVKAIQEQQQMIEDLKKEIETLKRNQCVITGN
jgi:trimeric autotransporter adhesin